MGLFLKEKFKRLNKKKLILLFVTLASICVLFSFRTAKAGLPGEDIAAALLNATLDAIFEGTMTALWFILLIQIVMLLSNLLVGIGGALLSWTISLNLSIPLTHCAVGFEGCLVDTGWVLARNLANMFFIIALVIIAFATILGLESYGMRRLLVPLILIALLINFSQVLVGAVVDFASVFMEIFAEPLVDWVVLITITFKAQTQALIDFAMGIMSSMLYLICPPCAIVLGIPDPLTFIFIFFAKVLMIIAFNIFVGIIYLILAAVFLLRIPMLWILTIVAPMALVCYLFPFLRSKYKWWVDQVGQWTFIGVFALFWLYLGMSLWQMIWTPEWAAQWKTSTFGYGAGLPGGLDRWIVDTVLPGLVFLLFLMLAMEFAQKTNAIFAAGVIGFVAGLGSQLKGRIESGLQRYPRAWARKGMKPEQLESRARTLERIPGFRGRAVELREEAYKKTRGHMEEGERRGEKVAPQEAARMYWNNALGDPYKNIGLLSAHAKDIGAFKREALHRGMSQDEIDRKLNESLILAGRHHDPTLKKLIKSDLHLATLPAARERVKASARISEVMTPAEQTQWNLQRPGLAEEVASARLTMKDFVKPEDVDNMDASAFRYLGLRDAFVREGKIRHFERLGYQNPKAQQHVQEQMNRLTRTGQLWSDPGYAEPYRMFTDPNSRRRLEQSGYKVPNVPWHCPVCGHMNNRNVVNCVQPGCRGRRPY